MSFAEETLFWLVPCAADEARFSRVIKALAGPRDAAIFTPHMTLGAVRGAVPDLGDVLGTLSTLTLSPLEIDKTDAFTMSLFVRFQSSPQLLDARQQFERLSGFRLGRAFDPHISLMYGAPEERDALTVDASPLLSAPVVFDRLVAMHIPLPVETQADIRKWRHVAGYEIPSTD